MVIVTFILAVLLVLAVVLTYVPIRRDPFSGFIFFVGWLTGELAGQLAVLVVVLFAVLGSLGGFHKALGDVSLVLVVLSVVGLIGLVAVGHGARTVVRRSLAQTPGHPIELTADAANGRWFSSLRTVAAVPWPGSRVEVIKDIDYHGDDIAEHRLDIIRPAKPVTGAPVMIYVHGGAWVLGDKREQGKPMMFELAARGWVCATVNYRLSPKATWPDHIVDVLEAIAWVKEHIAAYGGDPSFVALSGGSAGGHLAALAALAAGDPAFQPGFEDADASVDACIPFYGVLEMTADKATSGRHGPALRILLERRVMKTTIASDRGLFEAASPLHRVRADAPPFLVFQGSNDTLVPPQTARAFVAALREVSSNPVSYVELTLAQHAFDVLASPRCAASTAGVVAFLDAVMAERGARQTSAETDTQW